MNKRPKILYIPLWYPTLNFKSQGIFNKEHVHVMKKYVDVTVLHFTTDESRHLPIININETVKEGVRTFEVETGLSPIPKTSIITWSINLYNAIDKIIKIIGRPDLLHSQDKNSWVVGYYGRKHKIPYIISQHWSRILGGRLNFIERLLYKKSFSSAAVIIPAHYNAKKEYQKLGLLGNVMWLPNVYSPDLFYAKEGPRDNTLLHVSGFTKEKNVENIILAFRELLKELPNIKLILVGGGERKKYAEHLARKILPKESYEFKGILSKANVAVEMQRTKGFIFPSSYETFGCTLMEAMACNTPVLTTRVGGIPGVVPNENYGILVDVEDIDQIKEGMLKIMNETHGLDVEFIEKRTYKLFSEVAIGKKLLNIYQGVINEYNA